MSTLNLEELLNLYVLQEQQQLNLYFTRDFNVHIREGVDASQTLRPSFQSSSTGSTLKFKVYIRGAIVQRALPSTKEQTEDPSL